jgi:hypothetical protein
MARPVVLLSVCALAGLVALPAAAPARPADAVAGATCTKEAKRLKTFQRGMKAAKRRFFRKHRSAKARKRFVARQQRTLAARKRALRRCRAAVVPPAPAPPAPVPAPPVPDPGPGPSPAPEPPARDFIEDVVSAAARFTPAEVSTESGVEYVRTQLELELAPGATKAAMDALLSRLGAQVVSSLDGVGLLTVRIPDPGSLSAARALVAGLTPEPVLTSAQLATVPVTTELPETITPADAGLLRPQLASRAAGAWNARGGLAGRTPPTLVMTDYFGDGPPGPEVAVGEVAADFATGNLMPHGYTVLGMAAGTFEPAGGNLAVDQVTGLWGGPDLPLRVVDLRTSIAGSTMEDRLLQLVQGLTGDVVVSTSLAAGCAPAGCTAEQIRTDALQWIQRVRGAGLEGRILHVVAAGNIYANLPSDSDARFGSPFIAAAKTPLPGVANLTNTIVVENTTASDPASGPIRPVCLTSSSKRGGDVSAVGTDIKSLGAPGVARSLTDGGTSNAAPQVAGAAAALWALAPALTPDQVAARLRQSARPVTVSAAGDARCDAAAQPAPALDAYAAVLAADAGSTLPARAAVLDADDTGQTPGVIRFDEDDLTAFGDALTAGAGAVDYGRSDLNGDGRTGGTSTDRVDLDPAAAPQWGLVQRTVAGLPLTFDERALTDVDVLCHAAHGPLYQGDVALRDAFTEERCTPPVSIQAVHPAQIKSGETLTLAVRATRTDRGTAQAGVTIDLDVTGGTATPPGGDVTDQNGDFTARTTIANGEPQLKIVVTARVGDRILDEETVIATRPPSATVVRTFNLGSATAFAGAFGSGQGDNEKSLPGATSFTGSAEMTDAEEGDTAAGSGTVSFVESYAGDQLLGAEVDISGSGTAAGQMAQGEGGGAYTLKFTVGTGGIAYSVTGSVSANGTDPLSCTSARGHSYLFRQTQPSGIVYDTCAPRDPSQIASSGTLAAGSYEFYVDAIAHTNGGTSSAAADVTLTLGP